MDFDSPLIIFSIMFLITLYRFVMYTINYLNNKHRIVEHKNGEPVNGSEVAGGFGYFLLFIILFNTFILLSKEIEICMAEQNGSYGIVVFVVVFFVVVFAIAESLLAIGQWTARRR